MHNYVNPFSPYVRWEARLVALISYIAMTVILIFIVNKVCNRRSGK